MSEPNDSGQLICGRCSYFKRTGGVARGMCRYFRQPVYSGMECLTTGKPDSELPQCETCGSRIQPARTVESNSRYCEKCWRDDQHRRQTRYLTLGAELATSVNGGLSPRLIAWCHWNVQRHSHHIENHADTGLAVGALAGGVVGAAIGQTLGSVLGPRDVDYDGTIGIIALTDSELLLLDLGRCYLGAAPQLKTEHVQACAQDENALAGMKVIRIPLMRIRPESEGDSIQFEFEKTTFRFSVAKLPEIPNQPDTGDLVRGMEAAGTPPSFKQFLHKVLAGPPEFSVSVWRLAASDSSYWEELLKWLETASLDVDTIYLFLLSRAAAVSELQSEDKYIGLLWNLLNKVPSDAQEQVGIGWRECPPPFLNHFVEKLRAAAQQLPFGSFLAARRYKKLETLLTGAK